MTYYSSSQDRLRDDTNENTKYEYITVMLEKSLNEQGFGIGITGGTDTAALRRGDPTIVVSDVVPDSPADTLVNVGDILIAINGENVEKVEHQFAVEILRSLKKNLLKRRRDIGVSRSQSFSKNITMSYSCPSEIRYPESKSNLQNPQNLEIMKYLNFCHRNNIEESTKETMNPTSDYREINFRLNRHSSGFGLFLGNLIFVKDKVEGSSAYESDIQIGDILVNINGVPVESCRSTDEVLNIIKNSGKKINLDVIRPGVGWLPTPLAERTAYVTLTHKKMKLDDEKVSERPPREQRVTPRRKILRSDNEDEAIVAKIIPDEEVSDVSTKKNRSMSILPSNNPGFTSNRSESSYATPIKQIKEQRSLKNQSNRVYESEIGQRNLKSQSNKVYESESGQQSLRSQSKKVYESESGRQSLRSQPNKSYETESSQQSEAEYEKADYPQQSDIRHLRVINNGSQLGIQLLGGNKYGIFVSALLGSSPAAKAGLRVGDQIVSVNGVDFMNLTREEAVLAFLAVRSEVIFIECVSRVATFEKIRYQQCDEFFIRVNFDYLKPTNEKEHVLRKGDLLMIRDTMVGGTIGSWSASKISVNGQIGHAGFIPNKTRAEQLAIKFRADEKSSKEMKRRLRPGKIRSIKTKAEYKSQDKLDTLSFSNAQINPDEDNMHIPAYQIVSKQKANFKRPVIIIGDAADIYREFLRMRHPNEFDIPSDSVNSGNSSKLETSPPIKFSQIQNVIKSGKHCLLDVSTQGIEILHHTNLPPIVIFLKVSDRKMGEMFRAAAVNMAYGKNRDPKSKSDVRYINKYASRFKRKYPSYITASLQIFEQPVDQVYLELMNIIRSLQNEEIFVSKDQTYQKHTDKFVLNSAFIESGQHSAAESEAESEHDSSYNEDRLSQDDKVFTKNKFESTSQRCNMYGSPVISNRPGPATPSERGRKVDISYTDESETNYSSSLMTNQSSSFSSKQRGVSLPENTKVIKPDNGDVELSLNAVMKIPHTNQGGLNESPGTKFSVYVPPGALPTTKAKEIFFKLYLPKKTTSDPLAIEAERVIVCGPEGTVFLRPIEMRIPFNERSTDTVESRVFITPDFNSPPSFWKRISLNYPGSNGNCFNIDKDRVALLVDRF